MKGYAIGSSVAFAIAYAAAMQVKAEESKSLISIDMTGAGTLNLAPSSQPVPGDEIILKVKSDATARDLTFGTGFTAPVLTGVINKTKVQRFVYDGNTFIATAPAVQIN